MRDIRQVLERWGAWVVDNQESVYWSPIAAGFKGLIPEKVKSRQQCTDNDALVISGIMAKLNIRNSDMHDLLLITMFSVRRLFSWPRNTGAQTLT